MRKMLILALIIVLCSAQYSYAHSPSRIEASYDPETSAVSVTVYHDVKDPKTHYIKEISVLVNGMQVLQDEYNQQSNNVDQPAVYELRDLKPGDKITVKASCNIAGRGTADIVVK